MMLPNELELGARSTVKSIPAHVGDVDGLPRARASLPATSDHLLNDPSQLVELVLLLDVLDHFNSARCLGSRGSGEVLTRNLGQDRTSSNCDDGSFDSLVNRSSRVMRLSWMGMGPRLDPGSLTMSLLCQSGR